MCFYLIKKIKNIVGNNANVFLTIERFLIKKRQLFATLI